jgi:hypothetical protein
MAHAYCIRLLLLLLKCTSMLFAGSSEAGMVREYSSSISIEQDGSFDP